MFGEARYVSEVRGLDAVKGFQCQKARVHEGVGLLLLDAGDGGQGVNGISHLLFKPDPNFLLGIDVDLPSGEQAGEAGVLAAPTDGQRELVGINQNVNPFSVLLNLQSLDLRRGKGVGYVSLDVLVPADDVNFFVVEFPDNILNALAAKPNAGTDGVYLLISRVHCEFGAKARFPGDGLDLDGAVVDLGNFELKQLEDKVGIPAGENNLGAAVGSLHGLDQAADAFAPLVFLSGHPLTVGQQSLKLAQVNEDIRAVESPYLAADDVADTVFELGVDQRFLRSANSLHQCLLGILRGDPAEIFRGDLDFKLLLQLGIRLETLSGVQADFVLLVGDRLHHDQRGEGAYVAVFAVDFATQFPGGADCALGCGDHCILDSADKDLAIEPLFALPVFHAGYKFCIHRIRLSTRPKPFAPNKKAGRLLPDFTRP